MATEDNLRDYLVNVDVVELVFESGMLLSSYAFLRRSTFSASDFSTALFPTPTLSPLFSEIPARRKEQIEMGNGRETRKQKTAEAEGHAMVRGGSSKCG